jgi:hypothetical protein
MRRLSPLRLKLDQYFPSVCRFGLKLALGTEGF